jgi:hypothetical protein
MKCKDCVVYLGNGTSTSCGLKFENIIICDVNLAKNIYDIELEYSSNSLDISKPNFSLSE